MQILHVGYVVYSMADLSRVWKEGGYDPGSGSLKRGSDGCPPEVIGVITFQVYVPCKLRISYS